MHNDEQSGRGVYRIHAVAELTGIAEATLRAWERRYDVPKPARTQSGYRLYSADDVERVRRMRVLCDSGLSPSEAARLVHDSPAELPLLGVEHAPARDPFQVAAARLVAATREMNGPGLENALRLAVTLADAYSVVRLVFCPALVEIGRAWERGEISVAHEHFAAELLSTSMRDLLRLVTHGRLQGQVLLACFADEEHSLPLYAAAFRFVEWGFQPKLLGARTPPAALAVAVEKLRPAFVGLSVTTPPEPARARELVDAYAEAIGPRPWGVGGAGCEAVAALVQAHGGDAYDLDDIVSSDRLERLLRARP